MKVYIAQPEVLTAAALAETTPPGRCPTAAKPLEVPDPGRMPTAAIPLEVPLPGRIPTLAPTGRPVFSDDEGRLVPIGRIGVVKTDEKGRVDVGVFGRNDVVVTRTPD